LTLIKNKEVNAAMPQNRLTKIRILGLLLGIGYNVAIATDSPDKDTVRREMRQIVNAFEVLKSKRSSEEHRKQAKEFLHSKDIIPEALYAQKDVERAWNGSWASFAQNVVFVNKDVYNQDSGQFQLSSGTGTLIDVGIPELRGRVIVTCAHVVLPNFKDFHRKDDNTEEFFSNINGSSKIISINSQKLRHFKRVNSGYFFRKKFALGKNNVTLSIEAECQRGKFLGNIPVTDIYVLTGNDAGTDCYDIAIGILKESVKYKGKIVPGVRLDKLNVFTEMERIDAILPRHHIRLEGPSEKALPVNKRPVVIGYGVTGLGKLVPNYLVSSFSEKQKQSFLGLNIKKVITLNGLDLNGQGIFQNMLGCNCTNYSHPGVKLLLALMEERDRLRHKYYEQYMKGANDCLQEAKVALCEGNRQFAKICCIIAKQLLNRAKSQKEEEEKIINKGREYLEQFKAKMHCYAYPLSGCGFSGSLVVGESDNESYNVFGIYSGPLFTDEMKNFIVNATQHHYDNYLCGNEEQGVFERLRRWVGLFLRR
jgi:hypothetical protein